MDSVQCPKGEIVWVIYKNRHGEIVYILTSKTTRDYYYLYEVLKEGKINKLGRSKDPPELEEKYNIKQKIFEE